MDRRSLLSLRSRFAGLPSSSYKTMGLRRIRDALALADRNPARVAELVGEARLYLPHAEAAR